MIVIVICVITITKEADNYYVRMVQYIRLGSTTRYIAVRALPDLDMHSGD